MKKTHMVFTVLCVVVLGSITTYATGNADILSQTSGGELVEDHHRHRRQAGPMPFPPGFPFPPHMGDMGRPNNFRGSFGRRPFNAPFPGRMSRQGFPTGGNRPQGSRFYPRQSGSFRNMRRPTPNAAAPGPAPTMMPTPRRTTQRMQTPNMLRNSMRTGNTMQQTKTPSVSNMESAVLINTASMENLRPQEGNARVSKETTRLQNTTFMSNGDQAPRRDQTSLRDQTSRDQVRQWDQAAPKNQTFRRDEATFHTQQTRNQMSQRDQQTTVRQQAFPNNQAPRLDQGSSRNQASLRNQASQRDQTAPREQAFPNNQAPRLDQGSSRNQASLRNQASQRDQTALREQAFLNDQGSRLDQGPSRNLASQRDQQTPLREQSFANDQVSRRTQTSLRNQTPRSQMSQHEQQTTLRQQSFSNDRGSHREQGSRRNQASQSDQNSLREQTSSRIQVSRRDQSPLQNQASLRDQPTFRNPTQTLQDAGNTNFSPTPEPDILATETSNMLGGAKVLEISFVPSGRQAMSMQPSWVVSRPDGTVAHSDRQGVSNIDTLDQVYMNEPQSVEFGRSGPIGNAAEHNPMSEMMVDSRSPAQDFQQQGQNILGMMETTGSSMTGGQGEMRHKLDRFVPSMDTLDGTVNGNIGGPTAQDFQQVGGQMRNKFGRYASITSLDGPLTRNAGGSAAQDFQQQGNEFTGMIDGQRLNNHDGFLNSFDTMDRRVTGNMGGSSGQDFQQLGQNILGMMDKTVTSMRGGRGKLRNNIDEFSTSINTIDRNHAGDSMSKNFHQQGNDLMSVMDAAESSLISGQGQMTSNQDGFSNSFNTVDGGMTGNIGGAQDFQHLGQHMIGMVDSTGSFLIGDQEQAMNNMDGFVNSLNNIDGSMPMSRDVSRSAAQDSNQSSQDTIGMIDPTGSSISGGRGNRPGAFASSFDTIDGRIDMRRSRMNNLNQADLDMLGMTIEQVPLASAPADRGVSSSVDSNNDMHSPMFEGNSQTLSPIDIDRSTSRNGRRLSSTNSNVFSPSGSHVMDRNGHLFMDNRGFTDPAGSMMMDGGYLGMQDSIGLSGPNTNMMDINRDALSNMPKSSWADSPSSMNRNTNNAESAPSQVDTNRQGPSMMDMNVESFMNDRGYTDITGPVMMDGALRDAGTVTRLNGQKGSNNEYLSTPLDSNANRNSVLMRNDRNLSDGTGPSLSQMDPNQHELSVMNGLSFSNSRFSNTDASGSFLIDGGNRGAQDFIGASV